MWLWLDVVFVFLLWETLWLVLDKPLFFQFHMCFPQKGLDGDL
jgi:hypothetical protein